MSDFASLSKLNELLLLMLDDQISPEQLETLNLILTRNPQAARYYCEFIGIYVELGHYGSVFVSKAGTEDQTTDGDFYVACRQALERLNETTTIADQPSPFSTDEPRAVDIYWDVVRQKNAIKEIAEKAFARFKEEERQRQEALAYRQYVAMRRKLVVGVSAVTALVIIVLAGGLVPILTRDVPAAPIASVDPATPPVVAVISESSRARWADEDPRTVGTELNPGTVILREGFAELTFKSNAKLILEAPAELDLINGRQSGLKSGILTAYVPEAAKGFVVRTPSVEITDLGTAFGLQVAAEGVTDLHVLSGYVATVLENESMDEAKRARTYRRDEAVRLDARHGTAQPIPMDKARFSFSWEDVLYKPRLSGQVTFRWETPDSLALDAFESDNTLFVFPEKRNVVLSENLAVDIVPSGDPQPLEPTDVFLPTGSRVDSYLIHWDPRVKSKQEWKMQATVRFSRPIVGLIVGTSRLNATDHLFGVEQTQYPSTVDEADEVARGLEMDISMPTRDRLTLSEDRLELQMSLYGHVYDHMRILVTSFSESSMESE